MRRDFLESMIQIIQREGRTILFSSHILGDVERVADRIGIMVDGVLRVDCPTERFKDAVTKVVNDEHRRIIESLSPFSWDAVELSLEDAFIEYTRGHKRSLPLFSGEDNHVDGTHPERVA